MCFYKNTPNKQKCVEFSEKSSQFAKCFIVVTANNLNLFNSTLQNLFQIGSILQKILCIFLICGSSTDKLADIFGANDSPHSQLQNYVI
jgi:hypothetical protein